MSSFSGIFTKDVTYDNIKSHKKAGFRPLFRSYIFGKTTGGVFGLNPFCRNATFIMPIYQFQKDRHQDKFSFAFVQSYQKNCLNILAGNSFPKEVMN